jgi:hypothetical protein
VTLSTSSVSRTQEYRWYDESQNYITTTSSSSYTVNATSSATYYIAAKNGCGESSKAAMNLDVAPEPATTSAKGGINMEPDELSLTPYNYDNIEWGKPDNTIINDVLTITADISGTYSVRVNHGNQVRVLEHEVNDVLTSVNQNYIISENILVPGITNAAEIGGLTVEKRSRTIQYFDGLGRPMQQVNQQASPAKKDIIVPVEYDPFGRQARDYLPYLSGTNNGLYKETALKINDYSASDHYNYYNDPLITDVARDQMPYAEKYFEASPLNRVLKQGAPGVAWQPDSTTGATDLNDHSIKFSYEINDSTDNVKMWQVSDNGFPYYDAFYLAGELYKNITYDEKGDQVIEYRDKLGQIVLKSVQANAVQFANTYYVYDDFGRLRYVLPRKWIKGWKRKELPRCLQTIIPANMCISTKARRLRIIIKPPY